MQGYFEVSNNKDHVCEGNSNKNSLFATSNYSFTNFIVQKVFIGILFGSLQMHLHMNTFIMCLGILPVETASGYHYLQLVLLCHLIYHCL